ncbi:MAG: class D sortase [Acidobacteriia bacterium]|nr:class D sortase [Terriglobia bacterium]
MQRALVGAAIGALGYCAFAVTATWIFQREDRRRLDQMMFVQPQAAMPAVNRGLMARLEIPRLGVSVMVAEGDDEKTLRRAVGHISNTTLPGQPGNVGLAGHRDTFFRPLRNIKQNDVITLTTPGGEYRYRVVSTRIVSPTAVWVLDPGADEVLTLVTCYPFYFVGSAPNRFIVRAQRIT